MASSIAGLTVKEFFASKAPPKIVSICASQRAGSFNKMLHDYAVSVMESHGAQVTPVDLHALNLPLYCPELDQTAFPTSAQQLKNHLMAADGIFIASPEYNGLMTPLLYNSITWATRGEGDMYAGFKGKCASVMATSPGPMGGLRMIRSLQHMLADMGTVIVPGANAIGNAFDVFDKEGKILDDVAKAKVETTCGNLVHFCRYQANRDADCAIYKELQHLTTMGEYGQVDIPDRY